MVHFFSTLFSPYHLIIIGKYYLYINASAKKKFQFFESTSLVHNKLLSEKYNATKSDEPESSSSFHSIMYFLFLLYFILNIYSVL